MGERREGGGSRSNSFHFLSAPTDTRPFSSNRAAVAVAVAGAAATAGGATEYYGTMVKLLSRAHLSATTAAVPPRPLVPPLSLCPYFSFAVYSRNTYRSCWTSRATRRDAARRMDGRGEVALRETHPKSRMPD